MLTIKMNYLIPWLPYTLFSESVKLSHLAHSWLLSELFIYDFLPMWLLGIYLEFTVKCVCADNRGHASFILVSILSSLVHAHSKSLIGFLKYNNSIGGRWIDWSRITKFTYSIRKEKICLVDVNCFTPLADFHAFVLFMANTHLSMDWRVQNASAESESPRALKDLERNECGLAIFESPGLHRRLCPLKAVGHRDTC